VSLLKESMVNAATAVGSPVAGVVRRARSGTVLSRESEYSRVPGEDEEDGEGKEELDEEGEGEVGRRESIGLLHPQSSESSRRVEERQS
jgi:hypothetical protein